MWTVHLTAAAAAELAELAEDQRAHFMWIRTLIKDNGLERGTTRTWTTWRGHCGK